MTEIREHRPVISGGLLSQLPDTDPGETSEWVESLRGMAEAQGQYRAR
jgi:pyruvate dehydrogenase E1 component